MRKLALVLGSILFVGATVSAKEIVAAPVEKVEPTVAAPIAIIPTEKAAPFLNSIEVGFETEDFLNNDSNPGNKTYSRDSNIAPYVAFGIQPIASQPLKLDIKYMYQYQYGREKGLDYNGKFKTNRNRLDFAAGGYSWKAGDYAFSPKIGFRYETFDINERSSSNQQNSYFNLRFYPNMTYKLSNKASLYMDGFTGPAFVETDGQGRKDGSSDQKEIKRRNYNNDWYQELQVIGLKYQLDNKDSVWTSLYSEYKDVEGSSHYSRWQARLGYNWSVTPKLSINPYIRYDLSYDIENDEYGASGDTTKDAKGIRVGTTASYKLNPSLSLLGEIYYDTSVQEEYNGTEYPDKEKMFYKLAVKKTF